MHKHSEGYLLTGSNKFEHRVIASKALGKPLKRSYRVHHIDEVRDNNENRNLVLCENQSYHRLLHLRSRSLEASGHPDYFYCPECKAWKPQSEFSLKKNGGLCKPCRRVGSPRFKSKADPEKALPIIKFNGLEMKQADWARHLGISPKILWQYLTRGKGHTIEEAINHYS